MSLGRKRSRRSGKIRRHSPTLRGESSETVPRRSASPASDSERLSRSPRRRSPDRRDQRDRDRPARARSPRWPRRPSPRRWPHEAGFHGRGESVAPRPKIFNGRNLENIRTEPPPVVVAAPAATPTPAAVPGPSADRQRPVPGKSKGWETLPTADLRKSLENLSVRDLVDCAMSHIEQCKSLAADVKRLKTERPVAANVQGAGLIRV